MEERLPAGTVATAATDDDPPLLPLHPPPGAIYHETDSGTYVVQVPKDQIYRVPPPENAAIAERYRNPISSSHGQNDKRSSSSSSSSCCCWHSSRFWWGLLYCAGTAIAITLLLYITYLIVNPKNPQFTVLQVLAKNTTKPPPPPPSSSPRVEFLISLRATNPNTRLGVYYDKGGEVALLFKEKMIGTGTFLPGRRLYQEERNSTVVRVAVVAARSSVLPQEIKKSVSNVITKGKEAAAVEMSLTVEVPVRMKIGAVKTWGMDMSVACTFRVSALGKDGRVASQQCRTAVKP